MRKRFIIRKAITLAAAIFLSSCNSNDSVKQADEVNEHKQESPVMETVEEDDTEFMTRAASGGMMEVEAGKLAQSNAASEHVKKFAVMIVEDHTKANNELKALATSLNVTLPTSLSDHHKMMVDELSKKTGKDFDKAYIDMMVDDHVKDIEAFKDAANNGKNSDLRAFASKTVPTLQTHLDSAKGTQKILENKK
jgi:putative membrane protein